MKTIKSFLALLILVVCFSNQAHSQIDQGYKSYSIKSFDQDSGWTTRVFKDSSNIKIVDGYKSITVQYGSEVEEYEVISHEFYFDNGAIDLHLDNGYVATLSFVSNYGFIRKGNYIIWCVTEQPSRF